MNYSPQDNIVNSIGDVILNDPVYRIPDCVVFFVCINPSYPIQSDSKGFYHTPHSFASEAKAKECLDNLENSFVQAYVVSRNTNPEFRLPHILNVIRSLGVDNLSLKPISYSDRDWLAIGIAPNTGDKEKRIVLATLLMLNAKGYLGDSGTFKQSAINLLEVI